MPMNNYASHITHTCPTHYYCGLHIDPATTTCTSTKNALPYMCQRQICPSNSTHMPQCNWFMWRYYTPMSVYASYELNAINNLTTNIGIHTFTVLVYTPEQICLQHCIYMFHNNSNVLYNGPNITYK